MPERSGPREPDEGYWDDGKPGGVVDGYLFFDTITPGTRDALFELVEDELLLVAAVTVSGSSAAFAAYEAPDVRAAYATVEAVADVVGRPAQRLLAMTARPGLPSDRPGRRSLAPDAAVGLALLPVELSRAPEVAHVASRVVGDVGVAVVMGGDGTVLVEVDGATLDEVEARMAGVLAAAGVVTADVMVTSAALGRGWAGRAS